MMNKTVFLAIVFLMVSFASISYAQTAAPSPSPSPKECTVPVVRPVDVRVRVLAKPDPKFSKRDRERYRGEEITLRSMFCGSGRVTDVIVTQGLTPEMNTAAIDAAHLIQFTPAEKDGKKVSQPMILKYFVRD